MSVYFVTGKLGQGKSVTSVGQIKEYLNQGRRVATNLDLYPEQFGNKHNKNVDITRLPDKPTSKNLADLGQGYEGKLQENKNGLIVLDECGTWFNSRTWNDPDRKALIDWFLHARKFRWDIIFIVQDISIVDKQARQTLCEHLVICKRLDRLQIPFFTRFFKIFGVSVRFPRLFMGKVFYGDNEHALVADRWTHRGTDLFNIYDTEQAFTDKNDGLYCMLTPWHLVGRYQRKFTLSLLLKKGMLYLLYYLVIAPYQILTGKQIPAPR
jgi:hypothetical protein